MTSPDRQSEFFPRKSSYAFLEQYRTWLQLKTSAKLSRVLAPNTPQRYRFGADQQSVSGALQ